MLRRVGKIAFYTVPTAVYFHDNIAQITKIEGSSMQPTLNPNNSRMSDDYVVLAKCFYSPKRGDVVVARSPTSPREKIVKRIIGLPGDIIRERGGDDGFGVTRVPKGHCWLEGDNKSSSYDSNGFGPTPLAILEGKVLCVCWPPTRAGIIHSVEAGPPRVSTPFSSQTAAPSSRPWGIF
mmetsp:Transcript_9947/g.13800  ORF Transcript_9947/g.13800 Transcript_9947/m.13800 type:complete len:179 (-) Transcript_9947:213-749(-)